MAELSVLIGADAKDLLKTIDKSEKALKDFEKVSLKTGKTVGTVGVKASKGVDKLGKSTVNATPALQEFSRVIQDAPFGIQGVANNITQLTSNFGYLSKSAGGTKAALKAMLGTLTGPAGILLAVSAITSLMVSFGDEMLELIGASNKLSKATAEYTAEAQTEILTLNQLVKIAKDENNSKKVRQGAIDEINSKYSKYLGNLDFEKIKTDDLTKSVELYSKSLLLKAKIQGAEELIQEENKKNAEELLTLESQRLQTQDALSKLLSKPEKEREDARRIKSRRQALDRLNEQIDDLENKSEKALLPLLNVSEKFKKQLFDTGLSDAQIKITDKNIKVDTSTTKKIKDTLSFDDELDLFDLGSIDFSELEKLTALDDALAQSSGDSFLSKLKDTYLDDLKQMEDGLTSFNEKTQEVSVGNQLFAEGASSVFSSLSNQITSSLSTGNDILDSFTQSILQSLTQIAAAGLQSLITDKIIGIAKNQVNRGISTGNAITVATSAAAALGPAGALALPGLIASQIALVNGSFAAAAFAKGSGGFSGDNNLAYLNRNEMILRPMEQSALYNAIRGHNLGSLANNTNTSNTSEIIGKVTLRGDKQVIQLSRAKKGMNRFFNS